MPGICVIENGQKSGYGESTTKGHKKPLNPGPTYDTLLEKLSTLNQT